MYKDSPNDKPYKRKLIILIMGRSGAGKTTYYQATKDSFGKHTYLNNDAVRALTGNMDFSIAGRLNAARTMKKKAITATENVVVIDMICPLKEMRSILKPDLIIWIDRDFESRYKDTDSIFTPPTATECGVLCSITP